MSDGLELLESLLARGLPATLRARGGSMWPALRDGDVLTLEPLAAPRPGDVIAARVGDALVVHRVARAAGAGAVLRGDALPCDDGLIPRDQLLGRVARVRRGARSFAPRGGRLSLLAAAALRVARKMTL